MKFPKDFVPKQFACSPSRVITGNVAISECHFSTANLNDRRGERACSVNGAAGAGDVSFDFVRGANIGLSKGRAGYRGPLRNAPVPCQRFHAIFLCILRVALEVKVPFTAIGRRERRCAPTFNPAKCHLPRPAPELRNFSTARVEVQTLRNSLASRSHFAPATLRTVCFQLWKITVSRTASHTFPRARSCPPFELQSAAAGAGTRGSSETQECSIPQNMPNGMPDRVRFHRPETLCDPPRPSTLLQRPVVRSVTLRAS